MALARSTPEAIMPAKTSKIRAEERPKQGQSVPLGDTGDGETGVPANEQGISNRPGDKDEAPMDPANPASKPRGTTKDQINEMEGEGQAQAPGQDPPPNTNDK
jgi:hypothetical protein